MASVRCSTSQGSADFKVVRFRCGAAECDGTGWLHTR